MRIRLMMWPLAVAVVLAPVMFGAAGCACGGGGAAAASSASGCGSSGGGVQSCSPSATDANFNGRIGAQQAGPQQPVAWGVYPQDSAGVFTVTITVDGQVYDKKTQPYPPHGSAIVDAKNKRYLPSGGIFRIDGSVKRPNGQEEVFYFQCKLA